ncbi:MAG: hydrolase, partial [Bacteroidota bacterium]
MYRRRGTISVALIFLSFFCISQTQVQPTKSYTTDRLLSEIVIDGKLDDEAWSQVSWGGDFVGHDPEYLAEPSQKTQFKILYDAKFLYVGIRAFDTEPDKIVKRMSRRDG